MRADAISWQMESGLDYWALAGVYWRRFAGRGKQVVTEDPEVTDSEIRNEKHASCLLRWFE